MVTCLGWPHLYGGHHRQCQYVEIQTVALPRAFVLTLGFVPGGAAEPPATLGADLLVLVALRHALLFYVVVAVHRVYAVMLVISLSEGCQWNSNWIALVLSSRRHAAVYSVAL
ncbi:hypothetical protein TB2_029304 [Malus domestica]